MTVLEMLKEKEKEKKVYSKLNILGTKIKVIVLKVRSLRL